MAIRQLTVSDISGKDLTDPVRVVVNHPDHRQPLELDISPEEADKLQSTALRLVEFEIHSPGQPTRKATIETKVLDKLFGAGVDFDKVLEGARRAEVRSAPAKASTRRGDRLDYTSPEHAGKLHRGRITEAEAEWVRNNQAKASKNRQSQGHGPIDFNDPTEKKRYGIK